MQKSPVRFWVLLGLLAGLPLGTGIALFSYADGFSYLSKDPQACGNCHVMQANLASWRASSHHTVAGCNDCHTSGTLANRYRQKAQNGLGHSWAFTTGHFAEPIRIKQTSRAVVLENCLFCHSKLIDASHFGSEGLSGRDCLGCHKQTGHRN